MFRLYLYLIVHKIFPIRGYFFPVGLLYLVVTPYIYYYISWLGIAPFIIVRGSLGYITMVCLQIPVETELEEIHI